ncbi:UDP-2,3-diacylglucosamine diphosphatase [Campylobacter sp. RM16190]|uniref:UDP-2,3-diacylglucosamine diphosphatase n=1 Tax=Campylobacter sp. RM16190 TaxID=1705727 RepID=UPI00147636C3|nr:UDP-2,3-diacylglucosamine diphosphatase [Campylobacter sp. RM16190]
MSQTIIKNGSIFIADAHENENRRHFLKFLQSLKEGKIKTSQLFIMGDMFDFLSDFCDYSLEFASEYIRLLNELGEEIEIHYFEGNHDFNLGKILKNIKVYPIENQPANFLTQNQESVQIAHGDIFLPFIDKYALRFLRLKPFLKSINFIDKILNFRISKAIFAKLRDKNLSYKILNFREIIARHLVNFDAKFVIEGHFHQGEIIKFENREYINIPCFAYDQSYFVVEYDKNIKFANTRGQNV